MSSNDDFLVEQYRQCHECLRDSDQKRDLILGAYTTISLGFYGLWEKFVEPDLLLGVILLLVGIGLLVGATFTFYRAWHVFYVIQATVIQEIVHKGQPFNNEAIKKVPFRFNHLLSVELAMFGILHCVIVFHLLIGIQLAQSAMPRCVMFTLTVLAIIEFGLHFGAMATLDSWKNTGLLKPQYLWLLQGL
jgi:hypothetical protein